MLILINKIWKLYFIGTLGMIWITATLSAYDYNSAYVIAGIITGLILIAMSISYCEQGR